MTTYTASVKFPKLNFDDYVQHENRKVQLTHYDTDHKTPLFLQFLDDEAKPFYCIGFKNAIEWLKTGILENPKPTTRIHKAKLGLDTLVVTTTKWNSDGNSSFSLTYGGVELEVWEFEKLVFPLLSDLERSHLNLFNRYQLTVFSPSDCRNETWSEVQKHQFPTTFDINHYNLAKHIVERIAIVREVLKDESH
jgi:hypothetical protein